MPNQHQMRPDKISFPNRDNVSFFDKKYQKHFELIFESISKKNLDLFE